MVHVDIYLGGETGKSTIGARDSDGVVSIFDTYEFESSNYYDIKYHFRSLDTWIQGIRKSYWSEHEWSDPLLDVNPNKFTIFKVDDLDDGVI